MGLWLYNLILILVTCFVHGQEYDCMTPDGGVGICRPLTQCPDLKAKADAFLIAPTNSPQRQSLQNELVQRQCGYENNSWKVCCSECTTPDGKSGIRKNIRNCAHLMNMLTDSKPENLQYIRDSRLSSDSIDVCCGPPPTPGSPLPTAIADCDSQIGSLPDPGTRCCGQVAQDPSVTQSGNREGIRGSPWSVLLEHEKDGNILVHCGGTLISSRLVVTAAHCVTGVAWSPKSIRVGEYDTGNPGQDCQDQVDGTRLCNSGAISVPVESVVVHGDYDPTNGYRDDIALIKLSSLVKYTDFSRPICLPFSKYVSTENLKVAGWGKETRTRQKETTQLKLVNAVTCRDIYGARAPLWQKHICASEAGSGRDTCFGDDGGALTAAVPTSAPYMELVGVMGFGPSPCGSVPNVPGVYTQVYHYLDWIRQNEH